MARYANAEDVAVLWRPILAESEEEAKVNKLLDIASAKIRGRLPTLDERIAGGLEPDLYELTSYATIEIVMRVLRNPAAVRQSTTGPTSVTFDIAAASGLIQVTESDLQDLQPKSTRASAFGTGFVQIPQRGW